LTFPHLAQRSTKEVAEDAVSILGVGQNNVLQAAVALELLDRLFIDTA
jgi:hypothetical protein